MAARLIAERDEARAAAQQRREVMQRQLLAIVAYLDDRRDHLARLAGHSASAHDVAWSGQLAVDMVDALAEYASGLTHHSMMLHRELAAIETYGRALGEGIGR